MILAALLLAAHPVEPATPVDAERAFVHDAQALGQWTAFAKWAAPYGKLVGRSIIEAIPFATSQDDPDTALEWWPVESWTNCDGTFAFNVGGWTDPASGAKGRFHTIWVKTEQGWRYAVDMGADGDDHYLPPVDQVVAHRAACDRPPRPPMLSSVPMGAKADAGASGDQTLDYSLMTGPGPDRRIVVSAWDGERQREVYRLEWTAQ